MQLCAAIAVTGLLGSAAVARAVSIGPQVPLAPFQSYSIPGDVVVSGVGMRNTGGGTLNVAIPQGAVVVAAYLYWSLIAPEEPQASGTFNDEPVAGELIAQTGSACWPTLNEANQDPPTLFTWTYRADVTGAVAASNTLADFPSGLTGGEGPTDPDAPSAYPLLDGASLVVVYTLTNDFTRNIAIYDGARTFFAEGVSTTVAWGAPGAIAPVAARTVFVVANGQSFFPGDQTLFNGTVVAGPGATLRALDALDGSDGGGPLAPHGLWDSLGVDVSGLVAPGATSGVARVVSGDKFDCVTWIAQVTSVATGLPPTTTSTTLPGSTTTTTAPSTTTTSSSTTTTSSSSTTSSTSTSSSSTTSSTSSTSTTSSSSSSTTTTSSTSSTTLETTTTIVPSTTSTSTSSSTTTTSTSSTTSTTIEVPGCDGPRALTYDSLRCRLRDLRAFIANEPQLDTYERLLTRLIDRSLRQVDRSEARHTAGIDRSAKNRLRSAARYLTTIGYRIDSLIGRRALDPALRDALRLRVDELRDDMRDLRDIVGPGVP